ncbi:S8 family serine peptidase [Bacillus sp. DX1.1]|uniref:S8 family serine peptidase n=1 Tax=unclassified Bacillus (in: firmicutes) TaxID=185979 RepID=UPI00256FD6D9|nr:MULTISPECIES: S8 family serine peptidase [unclassified Bacillus (in: firmicutes)]MDM5153437.1 S8 family serine peptidase [Bacillus sp. DX1.1]WJE82392.1 S8 family serine peptidase [Bacillus sp. DX3.1]
MKRRKFGKVLIGTLAAGMLLSQGIPYNVLAENVNTSTLTGIADANSVLKGLTKEQRNALKTLDAKPGFVISPGINTASHENVNVIVEFKQAPAKIEVLKQAAKGKKLALSTAEQKVEASHKEFKSALEQLQKKKDEGKDFKSAKITREYKNAFNGVAMSLPGNIIEDLVRSGTVKRVWEDQEIKIDLPKESAKAAIQPKMADSVPQIGVDKLHAENITGKGIKVGVLDTGIDYNHPDLKDAYKGYRTKQGEFPNKIDPNAVKGWDFVNNDADPMETTYKDWQNSGGAPEFNNGSAYYTSHGTHVAGTIAAGKKNEVDYAVQGVAPDVDLYAYRVLGPYGSGQTNGILAAIDKAVKDDMDVINLSLGASINDPLYPTSVAVNNAMLAGVVAVVAAENTGPEEGTIGSPSAAALPITVGASDAAMTIPTFSADTGDLHVDKMMLLGKSFTDKLEDLKGKSLPIVYAGLGKSGDFTGKDVKGKLALIQRGEITFDEKIKNAKEAGAKAVIVYNNADGEITSYLGESTSSIPSFRLTKADGEKLQAKAVQGDVSLTFGELSNTKTEGDYLADFSSRGPANKTDDIKPDIVAPGVSVFSTVPEYINDPKDGDNYPVAYGRMSGTSMASPHTAGVAALILQEHPNYSPFEVKEALMNTAVDLKEERSVYEVGSGRIDAYHAVHADTSIEVIDKTSNIVNDEEVEIEEKTGSIAFGYKNKLANAPIKDSRKVMIKNNNQTEEKEFKLEVEFSPTSVGVQDAAKNGVKLNVQDSIKVAPGTSGEIHPEILIPENAELGIYEGYIHISNKNNENETYQIPFAVRLMEPGIKSVDLSRDAMATDRSNFHQYMLAPFSPLAFTLNSPMETIDAVVKDRKTGKALGIAGTFDASRLTPNVEYYMLRGMSDFVFPFTGDPNQPIGDKPVTLPDGDYELELVGYDKEGNSYTKGDSLIIDNVQPEIKFTDVQPGIHEVNESMFKEEDGQRALWVHGNIYDSTVDALKAKGLPYDQKANSILYYENSSMPSGWLNTIQANGDFKFGILPEEINKPLNLRLFGYDTATAGNIGNGFKDYTFVKEGTEYAAPSYDKDTMKLGEKITLTLNLNNVKQLMSGTFEIPYMKQLFKFTDVKPNPALTEYAKQHGLNLKLEDPVINTEGTWEDKVKVGASLEGTEFKGLDGDTPFLDVTFEMTGDEYYNELYSFGVNKFSYTKSGVSEGVEIPTFKDKSFAIIAKHSMVRGNIGPEAFLSEEGYLGKNDYTKLGAKAYAVSQDGKKYTGTINEHGYFEIHNVPVSDKEYEITVEMPGHLNSKLTAKIGKMQNGELVGQNFGANMDDNLAGDVNGDKMVDIQDARIAALSYEKEKVSVKDGDINQDGVVNETDIRFIEKNFLKKGPDAKENQKPKENVGPVTLEKILRSIGLEPNK